MLNTGYIFPITHTHNNTKFNQNMEVRFKTKEKTKQKKTKRWNIWEGYSIGKKNVHTDMFEYLLIGWVFFDET